MVKAYGEAKNIDKVKEFDVAAELTKVANGMQELVDEKGTVEKIAKDMLATTRNAFYIGRGIDYDVAQDTTSSSILTFA